MTSTSTPSTRYFAIAFKEWIQIRKGVRPPKTHTSVLVKEEKQVTWSFEEGGPFHQPKETVKVVKRKVKNSTFLGGSTLLTVKRRRFALFTGFNIKVGRMVEISDAVVQDLIARKAGIYEG